MSTHGKGAGLPQPCTRGLAARAPLTQLDRYRHGAAADVLARIPAESLSVIESTNPLGWVPVEHERYVAESVFAVLGPDDGVAFFRWLVTRHMVDTPMFRPVMAQVSRMFGIDPGKVLRVAPKPFALMFRDFGRLVPVDRGPQWAEVELRDAAPIVLEHSAYRESWRGALSSTFDMAIANGETTLEVDLDARLVRYRLSW